MNITQITIVLLMFINVSNLKSQDYWRIGKTIKKEYKDDNYGQIHERIDTTNNDTIRYTRKSDRYLIKSSDNIILVDGHMWGGMGTPCGCEPTPHGYWIEKYRNGKYKSQGKYFCREKVGTWTYYYENGQISKIESFRKPYEKFAKELNSIVDAILIKNYYLRDGPYLEYYPNGQLKIEGTYKIFEEYSKTDTIFEFDLETFAPIITVIEGDYWIPRSKKVRTWNFYDENGRILEHEKYPLYPRGNDIRSIESTYFRLISEFYEELEKAEEEEKD
jgi:hypothetical protein